MDLRCFTITSAFTFTLAATIVQFRLSFRIPLLRLQIFLIVHIGHDSSPRFFLAFVVWVEPTAKPNLQELVKSCDNGLVVLALVRVEFFVKAIFACPNQDKAQKNDTNFDGVRRARQTVASTQVADSGNHHCYR